MQKLGYSLLLVGFISAMGSFLVLSKTIDKKVTEHSAHIPDGMRSMESEEVRSRLRYLGFEIANYLPWLCASPIMMLAAGIVLGQAQHHRRNWDQRNA